jgi:hypothetical protein
MVAVIDKLAEPRTMRKLLGLLVALVVVALVLAAVAIIRDLGTSSDVTRVQRSVFNITNPSPRQLDRGIDRAIRGLTIAQRRLLLDRLLVVATPTQRKRLRTRLRSLERRERPARVRVPPLVGPAPIVRHKPGRGRVARPRVPAPAPVVPRAVAPPPVLPVPPVAQPFAGGPGKGRGKALGHAHAPGQAKKN